MANPIVENIYSINKMWANILFFIHITKNILLVSIKVCVIVSLFCAGDEKKCTHLKPRYIREQHLTTYIRKTEIMPTIAVNRDELFRLLGKKYSKWSNIWVFRERFFSFCEPKVAAGMSKTEHTVIHIC